MPTLADMLSARSPAYGAARRKYGLSPDMLVTPPGLMRGASPPIDRNRAAAAYGAYAPRQLGREELSAGASPSLVRAMFGDNGARTVPLAGNLKPPAPLPAPLSNPQEAAEFASRWNVRPDVNSTATAKPGGGVQMRGRWADSGGGVQPGQLDTAAFIERNPHLASQFTGKGTRALAQGMKNLPETDASRRRSAYLLNQRVDQMMRRGGPQAAALAEALGIEDRLPGVVDNAAARAAARRQRLADRQRVPSPLEQMAMRNPALALQLMSLNQRGQIAQGDLALRRSALEQQGGLEGRRLSLQEMLGMQGSQDRRFAIEQQTKESALDRALKEKLAEREGADAALAAGLTANNPIASRVLQQRLLGQNPGAGTAQAPLGPAASVASEPDRPVFLGGAASKTQLDELEAMRDNAAAVRDYMKNVMGLSGPKLNKALNEFYDPNAFISPWTRTESDPEGDKFFYADETVDAQGNVYRRPEARLFDYLTGKSGTGGSKPGSWMPNWIRNRLGVAGMLGR